MGLLKSILKLRKQLQEILLPVARNAYSGAIIHDHIATVRSDKLTDVVHIDEMGVVDTEEILPFEDLFELAHGLGDKDLFVVGHDDNGIHAVTLAANDVFDFLKDQSFSGSHRNLIGE